MALRIVPEKSHASHTTSLTGAPAAPGIHDTLRANLSLVAPPPKVASSSVETEPQLQSTHPLEARLAKWRATQDALKMEGLRRTYGIAEPVKRGMELAIVRAGEWRPSALGKSESVHSDVLAGRDWECGWEDVFTGTEMRDLPDFHTEMEHKLKMNW